MKNKTISFILWGFISSMITIASAQDTTTLENLSERLRLFGENIPQEKVYVHMDNTCYFLGDTIWFKTYMLQTNTDKPSLVSKVLYAELWNHEGYLMERKMVELTEGQGHGFFALADTSMYGGYYELRAYSRWQLNWGEYEHLHRKQTNKWFFNDIMAREFFRDYEKLYSRVFPVYDRPTKPGEFFHDMTSRPMQRLLKEHAPPKTEVQLTFYPEGGTLVQDIQCRVAFEALTDKGKWCEGRIEVSDGEDVVATAQTQNRGRGVFVMTPLKGKRYTATFTCDETDDEDNALSCRGNLPKAEADGVTTAIRQHGDAWGITVTAAGRPARNPLGLTVMHEGRLEHFNTITTGKDGNLLFEFAIPDSQLPSGVHQVSVFDKNGQLWADRLFFVMHEKDIKPNITINGIKDTYSPFERIDLILQTPPVSSAETTHLSVAVRDNTHPTPTFDTGNIMTEMLLASEIRGYIPQPDWFFEKNDLEHRTALDLLMMTQGWRRFQWQDMAVKGLFELVHPAELTPVLNGSVHRYTGHLKEDQLADLAQRSRTPLNNRDFRLSSAANVWTSGGSAPYSDIYNMNPRLRNSVYGNNTSHRFQGKGYSYTERMDSIDNLSDEMKQKMAVDGEKLRREVRVHAEFTNLNNTESVKGDVETEYGRFSIKMPHYYGDCFFFLAASDTVKWKRKFQGLFKRRRPHQWIMPNEDEYPEYYVRLSMPYPRFVKPYSYYQEHLPYVKDAGELDAWLLPEGTTMRNIEIQNKRGRLRDYKFTRPAKIMDAYDAFNMVVDAGLLDGWYQGASSMGNALGRCLVGDMGGVKYYQTWGGISRENNGEGITTLSKKRISGYLRHVDNIRVFTDYEPRYEGDARYDTAEGPTVFSSLIPYTDGTTRVTYRDRFFILPGFAYQGQFYHPDYSQRPLPDTKDYRRTLYWNPDLQLDNEGKATIRFYNNGRQTRIAVTADGMTEDGQLMTGSNSR